MNMPEGVDPNQLLASLEKANKTSELFQQKNAELETVNDQLRLENVQLLQTVEDLKEEAESLREKVSKQKKQDEVKHKFPLTNKAKSSDNLISSSDEVKTLRRVKRDLEKQLTDSQSTTLSFQASFQAEFDLRSQIEQKLEELRERYERLIMENDQLRLILKAHNITAPSPPGLRSMPGSRKKKHAPKSRPMTMYSDLFDEGNKAKGLPARKAPSLGSLIDDRISGDNFTSKIRKNSKTTANGSETKILAETAQTVVVGSSSGGDKSASPDHKESTLPQDGVAEDKELLLPPVIGSRTDTLMWNAKGFLSRLEKKGNTVGHNGNSGDTSIEMAIIKDERDESELKEMMSSVSVKQLESAKAFVEASQRHDD